jgi:pyruvate formate lyase activating enzyme
MPPKHEARWYAKSHGDAVDCHLCGHRCLIGAGKKGFCRVRENHAGTLYTRTYGRVIASHVDPIEKKPLYHFLPGTTAFSIATPGCNFRCDFCQNWQISQSDQAPAPETLPYTAPEDVVAHALNAGARSIAYTYTEPTIFMEYALDCARLAHEESIANVFVSNGYETPEAVEAMSGLVDAANVDLKAFSDEFYRSQCKAKLEPVLNTIRQMHEAGIHLEVTTLVIPGLNDSEDELADLATFIADVSPDIVWHISRFHPQYKVTDRNATPSGSLELAALKGREAGLRYIYLGNVPTRDGQVTHCPKCDEVLIRRSGFSQPETHLTEPACPACEHQVPIILA